MVIKGQNSVDDADILTAHWGVPLGPVRPIDASFFYFTLIVLR